MRFMEMIIIFGMIYSGLSGFVRENEKRRRRAKWSFLFKRERMLRDKKERGELFFIFNFLDFFPQRKK
ncbi:hypothetical protein LguiA_031183 [Lonicera macranthoides]